MNRESGVNAPDQFEIVGDRGLFRPSGSMSLSKVLNSSLSRLHLPAQWGFGIFWWTHPLSWGSLHPLSASDSF